MSHGSTPVDQESVDCSQSGRYLMAALLIAVSTGCAPRFRNTALESYDPHAGYRFETLEPGENNTDDIFVFLAFSGGGTRAAALAYGVLQGLADVPLPQLPGEDTPRSLLDEVDIISSVSGGSFTAMGYALWHERLFDGKFKSRFLTHNVERDLAFHLLNPINLLSLPFPGVDSIDIASTYYDQKIFDRSTYGNLIRRGTRPFVVINATDMARQQTFGFTQDNFDILGSDLGPLPVGWAVGASSAFPVLLSPSRMHYYPGEPMRAAIEDALAAPDPGRIPGREHWAHTLLVPGADPGVIEIDAKNHKYLYLLDGGLADNLGLHAFMDSYGDGAIRDLIRKGRIRKLILIVVDAGKEPDSKLERKRSAPGSLASGMTAAKAGIYNNSAVMTGALEYVLKHEESKVRDAYEECRAAIARDYPSAEPPAPPPESLVESYMVDVSFYNIPERSLRHKFMTMVTSFVLPKQDVDDLIKEGHDQVEHHPEIQRLIHDLGMPGSAQGDGADNSG